MFSRTTRVLFGLALLAGGAWFLFRGSPDTPDSDDASRLVDFDLARVDGLVLRREADTLRFARVDSVWMMTEPARDRAEPASIASLLDAFAHARIERDLGATDDLSEFGLAPAQVTVVALAGADTLLDVALGKRTVDDAWCYARTGQSTNLLLVPTDLARGASLPRDDYRDHRVVNFQIADVESFELRQPEYRTTWWRRGTRWYGVVARYMEPGQGQSFRDTIPGDSVAVESVLRRLRGLRVASFLYGRFIELRGNDLAVDVWGAGHVPLAQLRFAVEDHSTRGLSTLPEPPRVFVVDGSVTELFFLTATELRDRRLIQFSPPDAERIEVVLPDVQGEIVRSGGVWAFPNPAMGRVDPDRAADFIRALRALKWTDVAPAASLADARFSITIIGAGGTILDQMRAEPRPDGSLLVTSRSARETRRLDREPLTALAATFARLKAP